MARSMGLDVGNRRIGVALSDALKVIARPLQVIDRKQNDAPALILEIIRSQQVDEVIAGYPYNADGSVGNQARLVEKFVIKLRQVVVIPVLLYDERDSTGEARSIISARKRKDPMQPDDAVAAAVILQRYLDEKHPITDAQDEDTLADMTSFDQSQ